MRVRTVVALLLCVALSLPVAAYAQHEDKPTKAQQAFKYSKNYPLYVLMPEVRGKAASVAKKRLTSKPYNLRVKIVRKVVKTGGSSKVRRVSLSNSIDFKGNTLVKPGSKVTLVVHVKPKKRKRTKWYSARCSWYGPGLYGNTMAGGGQLTPNSMVVAHRSMKFGTKLVFKYNGRTCTAVVKDRGPYVSGRTFDLGPGVAKKLGFGGVGTVQWRIAK